MTDPIEQLYNDYPYPDISRYELKNCSYPNLDRYDFDYKNIFIAGSGTYQACHISNKYKNAKIDTCDVASKSLEISKFLCKDQNFNNVTFTLGEFQNIGIRQNHYDLVIATGVIHHCVDRIGFFNKAYDITKTGGIFYGMVYFGKKWEEIRKLSKYFMSNNYTVEKIMEYFQNYEGDRDIHPIYEAGLRMTKIEIADIFLNPRYYDYSFDSFEDELEKTKWSKNKIEYILEGDKYLLEFRLHK